MRIIGIENSIRPLAFRGNPQTDKVSSSSSIRDNIADIIKRLSGRDREISDYGPFSPVKESFSNTNKEFFIDEVALQISEPIDKTIPDQKTTRYLKLLISSPSRSEASFMLEEGNKKDCLRYLKNPDLVDEIKDYMTKHRINFLIRSKN
jgi:hypothetical protein